MTTLLDKALDAVRNWPTDRPDEAAELLLALDRPGPGPFAASADESAAIDEALAQIARGDRASAEQVEAAFGRFRK